MGVSKQNLFIENFTLNIRDNMDNGNTETASSNPAAFEDVTPFGNQIEAPPLEVASYKSCAFWTKRAVEIEKLLRSLKESKVLLDQTKREILARKKGKLAALRSTEDFFNSQPDQEQLKKG